jgi:radical SAM protein with 4Fe4S-binding SPASM domain
MPKTHLGYLSSYMLDRGEFERQLRMIRGQRWPIQISSYLNSADEMALFLDAPERPVANRFCYKQWIRLDMTPAGDVSPCIQFPDLAFGNVRDKSAVEIWNGPEYARFRAGIRQQLLPVCPKCNALYLYDAGRQSSLSEAPRRR